jgi:hypothetical protein
MPKEFKTPQREILTISDVSKWINSEAHQDYINFLRRLNNSVKGTSTTSVEITVSENVEKIIKMLDSYEVCFVILDRYLHTYVIYLILEMARRISTRRYGCTTIW